MQPVWKLWRREKSVTAAENRTFISSTSNPQPSHCTYWAIPDLYLWIGLPSNESDLDITGLNVRKMARAKNLEHMKCEQKSQRTYRRNMGACSRNHCCRGKEISITYFECVSVASVIRHAKRMCHITLSFMACPPLPHVSTLSHKLHDFGENVTETNVCIFVFHYNFVWNISHSKKNWATYYHKCT